MVIWKEYMDRPPTSDEMNGWPWNGHLALVVDQFEVLDFDLKNTKEKNIFDNWRMAVSHVHTGILDSCLIVKTKNGGFHVIYRTDEIAGNTKLAETEEQLKVAKSAPTEDDIYKGLPEKVVAKMKADSAEIAKMKEDNLTRTFISKAAECPLIGATPEVGDLLKNIAKHDDALAGKVVDVLKTANARIHEGDLLKEKGENTSNTVTAYDRMVAKPAELRKSAPTLTDAQAFVKVYDEDHELRAAYLEERKL